LLVRKESLGHLVRATAMNAHRFIQLLREGAHWPLADRKALIEDISAKFKKEEAIEQFYASLFAAVPSPTNLMAPSFVSVMPPATTIPTQRPVSMRPVSFSMRFYWRL
jgi:hypothetical protein